MGVFKPRLSVCADLIGRYFGFVIRGKRTANLEKDRPQPDPMQAWSVCGLSFFALLIAFAQYYLP